MIFQCKFYIEHKNNGQYKFFKFLFVKNGFYGWNLKKICFDKNIIFSYYEKNAENSLGKIL